MSTIEPESWDEGGRPRLNHDLRIDVEPGHPADAEGARRNPRSVAAAAAAAGPAGDRRMPVHHGRRRLLRIGRRRFQLQRSRQRSQLDPRPGQVRFPVFSASSTSGSTSGSSTSTSGTSTSTSGSSTSGTSSTSTSGVTSSGNAVLALPVPAQSGEHRELAEQGNDRRHGSPRTPSRRTSMFPSAKDRLTSGFRSSADSTPTPA